MLPILPDAADGERACRPGENASERMPPIEWSRCTGSQVYMTGASSVRDLLAGRHVPDDDVPDLVAGGEVACRRARRRTA